MKQDTSGFCTFHFKMDIRMKNQLKGLALFRQVRSLSRLIVEILTLMVPLMEKEHLSGEQKGSKYEFVHDDPGVKRESTHVYMPDGLYRRIKLMHQDLNWYSMAQLLRGFLRVFLDLVDVYGDDYQEELDNLMGKCNADIEESRFSHEVVLQLLKFIHQKSMIIRLFTIYNKVFCPMKIFCL